MVKNDVIYEKTMENVRKHKSIKLVRTESRTNYSLSLTTNFFTEDLLAIKMIKAQILE